jgi:hypothetical protein
MFWYSAGQNTPFPYNFRFLWGFILSKSFKFVKILEILIGSNFTALYTKEDFFEIYWWLSKINFLRTVDWPLLQYWFKWNYKRGRENYFEYYPNVDRSFLLLFDHRIGRCHIFGFRFGRIYDTCKIERKHEPKVNCLQIDCYYYKIYFMYIWFFYLSITVLIY